MQRQQERARPNRPKPRRMVGELLIAWLVLLWGLGSGGVILPVDRFITYPLPLLLTNLLALLQAALCIVSGLCVLLRLRLVAKYGLIAIALCFLGLAAVNVWLEKGVLEIRDLIFPAVLMVFATLFFFLGRWIGQQGESEGQ